MANEFIERRLKQLEPMGARLGTRAYGRTMLLVSTIQFGDGRWTRVESEDRTVIRHYPGDIPTESAAKLFRDEIEAERAA